MSAAAVEAVRCGFRIEFSRASLPAAPAMRSVVDHDAVDEQRDTGDGDDGGDVRPDAGVA
jgi:hypothetical protein